MQRYEGASTIFGPYTLSLYLNKYRQLAEALANGKEVDPGPTPPDFSAQLLTFVFPSASDGVSETTNFGDVLVQPPKSVSIGDTVTVTFASGNPRHNSQRGGSFFVVEKLVGGDAWQVVATDANWETRLTWTRTNASTGESQITVEWEIDNSIEPGTYRIRHTGHYKNKSGQVIQYQGESDEFSVE